ncbi:MAG TPA: glycosyltransferase [Geopsychrobacteraceae bacterium]|nr:glycosyltransferase [Geopsychrobacteraceae bacterium]
MKKSDLQKNNNSRHGIPKMKILHIIASPKIGGAEKLLLTIVDTIDSRRFDVAIAAFVDSREQFNAFYNEASQRGANLYPVEINSPYDVRQLLRLHQIIVEFKPDVIHSHGYKTNILGFLLARRFAIPVVATIHGWLHSRRKTTQIFNRVNMFLLKRFDRVVAVSGQIERVLLCSKVSSSRLVTLRNVPFTKTKPGFDRSSFVQQYSLLPDSIYVGFVGRLEPVKGGEFFISAAATVLQSHSNIQFLIAGEGPEYSLMVEMAERLGISSQVKFLGFVDCPETLFQVLSLYVLPSLDEGVPLSLLEAMSAGVPVVASAVGGVPEVVEDGVNGLLVPAGDPDLLASVICRSLEDQKGTHQRIMAAKETIREDYNVERWIETLQELYSRLQG